MPRGRRKKRSQKFPSHSVAGQMSRVHTLNKELDRDGLGLKVVWAKHKETGERGWAIKDGDEIMIVGTEWYQVQTLVSKERARVELKGALQCA